MAADRQTIVIAEDEAQIANLVKYKLEKSGYEVLRAMKANPVTKSIPVIMLTARGLEQDYRATLLRFLSLQTGAGDAGRALIKQLRTELFQHGEPQRAALAPG